MKRFYKLSVIILSLTMLTACFDKETNEDNQTNSSDGFHTHYDSVDENTNIIEISSDDALDKIESGDEIIVMFGAYTWGYCQSVIGDYDEYSNNRELYYIDGTNADNDEIYAMYEIAYVPTFVAFANGEVADISDNYLNEETIQGVLHAFMANNE